MHANNRDFVYLRYCPGIMSLHTPRCTFKSKSLAIYAPSIHQNQAYSLHKYCDKYDTKEKEYMLGAQLCTITVLRDKTCLSDISNNGCLPAPTLEWKMDW